MAPPSRQRLRPILSTILSTDDGTDCNLLARGARQKVQDGLLIPIVFKALQQDQLA